MADQKLSQLPAVTGGPLGTDEFYFIRSNGDSPETFTSHRGSLSELLALVSGSTGKQTIWMPAAAMTARTTSGAASGTTELATNKVMVSSFDFDSSTAEYVQFFIKMPKGWDEGTVTFQPVWSHAATTTNFGVAWFLQAVALSDGDAGDAAFGTAQSSIDTGGATNTIYIGPESSAITIAGTPVEGDLVVFQLYRDPANGSDTMAIDARLRGVHVYYTTNAATDD